MTDSNTNTKSKENEPAAPAVQPASDVSTMIDALNKADANDAAKVKARKALNAVHGGNRPWPQLPPALRQAGRNDAKRLLADVKGDFEQVLVTAGYSKRLAARLCSDLGKQG